MTVYFLYYFAIVALYFLIFGKSFALVRSDNSVKSGKKTNLKSNYIFITTILLILIFGLRNPEMGNDLKGYLPSFDRLNLFSWKEIFKLHDFLNYEYGYIIFNKLVGSVFCNRQFFLFVCAAVSIIPIGYTIYKHSDYPLDSWFVYLGLPVFLLTFSGLRQAIAIGITTLSYNFIKQKKLVRFIFIILLASLFHSSALVFLLAYPVYRIRFGKRFVLFSIILLPVVWLLRNPLFELLTKLAGYNEVMDNNGAVTLFIVFALVYLFCVFTGDTEDETVNGFTNLFYIACLVQAMGGLSSIAVRAGYYYMIPLIIVLPKIINENRFFKNERDRQLVRIIILAIFITYGLYDIYTTTWAESGKYCFFWNEYVAPVRPSVR